MGCFTPQFTLPSMLSCLQRDHLLILTLMSLAHLQRSVCLCVCACVCTVVHIGSYFTQTPLCLQHTAGTVLPDIPLYVRACHRHSLAHNLTRSQHWVLICYNSITDIDEECDIFQVQMTNPPLSLVSQKVGRYEVLAIQSCHNAWTLAHEL